MLELWQPLKEFLVIMLGLLYQFLSTWGILIAWVAWWLLGVNWKKAWPVLARGAWVPGVLVVIVAALTWSQMAPSDWDGLRFVTIANFWWQLGAVSLLAGLALFCGWVQGYMEWTPAEIELFPAIADHGHGHPGHEDHDHGHHDHGSHDHNHH